jgi:CubicO group peptidase (beta-lactamase class C family)
MFLGSISWLAALRRPILIAAAAVFLLMGCANEPSIAASETCVKPEPDTDWPVAGAETVGFDGTALCSLLRQVASSSANIHGIVVERHGQIVAELYRSGPDRPINVLYGLWFASNVGFDASRLHDVRSVSKSVVGLLFGIEEVKAKAPGLDVPVLRTYPELKDLHDADRMAITFKHVLTMSSGLDWTEWNRGALTSDETRLYWKANQARFVLDRSLAAVPGTEFNYNGGGTTVLADTLVRTTGEPLLQIAREDLFEPLGITSWQWETDLHGRPLAFAGLRLRLRDMLKIGRLMNDHGRWRGRQVAPEKWVAESLRTHVLTGVSLFALTGEDVGYGYQWWTGRSRWRGRELHWASAIGNGGERIFLVPELDLSVAITAGEYGSAQIHQVETRFLSAILDSVRE